MLLVPLKLYKNSSIMSRSKTIQKMRSSTLTTHFNLDAANMHFVTYEGKRKLLHLKTAPPVIIMHGLFGSIRNWRSLCKSLSHKTNHFRQIIAVDARNHGKSPHTKYHSYPHLAEDIKALCTKLKLKKVALLGHSMGGRAVMYFALKYPQLADKLIVADVSPVSVSPSLHTMYRVFGAMREVKLPSSTVSMSFAKRKCDEQLAKTISNEGFRSFLLDNLSRDNSGRYVWRLNISILEASFHKHIVTFPDVGSLQFDGPVLFVSGEESDYMEKSDHPRILRMFPNAKFREIEGAGHLLHIDEPNEFLKICLDFLNCK